DYAYVYSQYVTIKSNNDKKEDVAYSATGMVKSAVYVRKGASTNYDKLGILNKNTKVTIVAKSSNNRYKIKFNGRYGYVCAQYINITNNSDNKEDKSPQSGVVNHAVYVRKGASTNYAKLDILNKNTQVTILSKTTYGWYKVQYKNGTGYVYSQYIDVNSTQK
ncbi:SH3 domain-containing protein, partial [Clostridium perfringens]